MRSDVYQIVGVLEGYDLMDSGYSFFCIQAESVERTRDECHVAKMI